MSPRPTVKTKWKPGQQLVNPAIADLTIKANASRPEEIAWTIDMQKRFRTHEGTGSEGGAAGTALGFAIGWFSDMGASDELIDQAVKEIRSAIVRNYPKAVRR